MITCAAASLVGVLVRWLLHGAIVGATHTPDGAGAQAEAQALAALAVPALQVALDVGLLGGAVGTVDTTEGPQARVGQHVAGHFLATVATAEGLPASRTLCFLAAQCLQQQHINPHTLYLPLIYLLLTRHWLVPTQH